MNHAMLIGCVALVAMAACSEPNDEPLGPFATGERSGTAAIACMDVPTAIFDVSCATAGCHTGASAAGGLDLGGSAATRLIGRKAFSGGLLVDPSQPEASVLYQRLLGRGGPRMPIAAPLDQNRTACVLTWIQSLGAKSEATTGGSETGRPPLAAGPTSASDGGTLPGPGASNLPTIRVGAGAATDFTDQAGNRWSADTSFTGGRTTINSPAVAVANTADDALYNHERWGGDAAGNVAGFSYAFKVPNGSYAVTLKFAETYEGAKGVGLRRFDVSVAGSKVVTDLDIYAEAGGNAAVDKTFGVMVTNGTLAIDFEPGAALAPKVDAIAIVPKVN